MTDRSASVLARLKNKANETGRSYHLCLQLFCQEEFLRRLQKSQYSDNFVLKGGLFLYALTEFDSRATVDIDFLIRNMPNTPEKLEAVVREIIKSDTGNDFVSFELKSAAPITVTQKYAGISVSMVAGIRNTRTPIDIDFGVGDVIVPRHEKRRIPTQLPDFAAPIINTYSIETTVAEKLDAILSLMGFTSRMKDYYDLYYLAIKFDFNGAILTEALCKTFENRDRAFTVEQFDQLVTFVEDDSMNKKWIAFTGKTDLQSEPYAVVLRIIFRFLRQPYSSVICHEQFSQNWSAEQGKWTTS